MIGYAAISLLLSLTRLPLGRKVCHHCGRTASARAPLARWLTAPTGAATLPASAVARSRGRGGHHADRGAGGERGAASRRGAPLRALRRRAARLVGVHAGEAAGQRARDLPVRRPQRSRPAGPLGPAGRALQRLPGLRAPGGRRTLPPAC